MADKNKKLKITARFAECFRDYRSSSYVDYPVHQLLAQRVYGIILGYEDVNDHDQLRYDPALAIALSKLNFTDANQAVLAGKSTLNRLEYCPETIIDPVSTLMEQLFSPSDDADEVNEAAELVPPAIWYRSHGT